VNAQLSLLPEPAPTARRRQADRNVEARVQAAIVEYIRWCAPQLVVFHPANGGYRTPSEAARFRWLGVLAGVPDLCLVAPGGRVCFIEVKSASGRLSAEQKVVLEQLTARGAPVAIARSIDDARAALELWNIPTIEIRNRPRAEGDRDNGPVCVPGVESTPFTELEMTTMLMSNFKTGAVKAEELKVGFREKMTIVSVGSREYEGVQKPIVFLNNFHGRYVVLNQTNLEALLELGQDSEDWIGADVIVSRKTAPFKGKTVPAIRLEPAAEDPLVAALRGQTAEVEHDTSDRPFAPIDSINDDIPF
jgi:hypothetical protein